MADVRCSFPDEQWKNWEVPSDANNPAQLRRMVAEWDGLKSITERLRAIDNNLDVALGKLLATYELVNRYGLQGTPPATAQPTETECPADDFSIALNDDL